MIIAIIRPPAGSEVRISVCLSVCLAHLKNYMSSKFREVCTFTRGLVCNKLCTSGFVDDVYVYT